MPNLRPQTCRISCYLKPNAELLEQPSLKEDNLRTLLELNGGVCEVVTGVGLGMFE